MTSFDKLVVPSEGDAIRGEANALEVSDTPIIPFIRGDGIGPDIWAAASRVFDAAVEKSYGGSRRVVWMEIFAGEASVEKYGDGAWLPEDTLKAIRHFKVAIKGPLTTPVGGGFRSLNVQLRKDLDLYACVRPVRWFDGVPAPVTDPQDCDIVLFRENTEDVYSPASSGKRTAPSRSEDAAIS